MKLLVHHMFECVCVNDLWHVNVPDLLSRLTSAHPLTVLDSQPKMREAVDYLSYLPLVTSEGLLRAMQPLLRVSPGLRDALILVLRKAMFSR